MMNRRFLGRLLFSALALTTTVGCMICIFDNQGDKATAMAVLTVAWIQAIRCLED